MFLRTDTSILGRWWWTVDRWSLTALCLLMAIGGILSFAGTPLIAERINLDSYYFVRRQFAMMVPSFILLISVSLLSPQQIRRISIILFGVCLFLLVATLLFGTEIKGARRWISLGGFSLQPSEFIKPSLAIVMAWLFSEKHKNPETPFPLIAGGLYAITAALILLQPDLGMTFVISAIWFTQFFLAGLPLIWVVAGSGLGVTGLLGAYIFLPHVSSRIDRFLDPNAGDQYQISQSLDAFMNGGFFGMGPGEGIVKKHLPDAHADFIFAVAGEEFGLILCLIVVGIFSFIVLRSLSRVFGQNNLFHILAVAGLTTQFALQALINMASSLHLIPTKGMTLPFLSYGGSSLLALSLGMGMLLALTKRGKGGEE
jgi:cell division protein FtsW